MTLPIHSLVLDLPASEKSALMDGVPKLALPIDRIAFELSSDGLKVHGLTELDVELAFFELRKRFPRARQGKPQVAYEMGPPLREPYYRATIDVPEDCLGTVIGDLISRRAFIESAREGPTGTRYVAEVPVSECFGYDTVLRSLTGARGKCSLEFSRYRRIGGDDAA